MYDVKDAQGNVVNWGAETHSPVVCENQDHWTKATLKPGDKITIGVFPSKRGSPRGLLAKIVMADGTVIIDDTTRGRQKQASKPSPLRVSPRESRSWSVPGPRRGVGGCEITSRARSCCWRLCWRFLDCCVGSRPARASRPASGSGTRPGTGSRTGTSPVADCQSAVRCARFRGCVDGPGPVQHLKQHPSADDAVG